jgi:hypothetical protein
MKTADEHRGSIHEGRKMLIHAVVRQVNGRQQRENFIQV